MYQFLYLCNNTYVSSLLTWQGTCYYVSGVGPSTAIQSPEFFL